MTFRLTVLCLLFWPALAAQAATAAKQEPGAIQKAVESFVRMQTAGMPGEVTFTVGAVDPRLRLPGCSTLEPFLPPGGRLWGNATVGVRCNGSSPWTVYVPVTVRIAADVVVSARPLAQNQVISRADIVLQKGDLAHLPPGTLTDPAQAVGKTMTNGIASAQPLRQDMLRSPLVVQQGQAVKLVAAGRGFTASSEGRALNNASEGQVVQVRIQSGQVIGGIGRHGAMVEVQP